MNNQLPSSIYQEPKIQNQSFCEKIVYLKKARCLLTINLIMASLLLTAGCGSISIVAPTQGVRQVYTPLTLQAQKNDGGCSFVNNSFSAYLDKGQPNQIDITNAFTRPSSSNVWTAQGYALPSGNHTFSVQSSFAGWLCMGTSASDSRQLAILSIPPASFVGLGDLPGGATSSTVAAISADGFVVVGDSAGVSGDEPFIWTSSSGTNIVKRHPRSAGQCDANVVCSWQRPHKWGVAASKASGVRLNERST